MPLAALLNQNFLIPSTLQLEDDGAAKWAAYQWSLAEEDIGLLPIIPLLVWDEDPQRWTDTNAATAEDEFLFSPGNYAPPFDPQFMDWTVYDGPAFDWTLGYGALASAMDDYDSHFLQPVGPGPAATGRSARFGFTQALHR